MQEIKIIKVNMRLSIGVVGADREEIVEVSVPESASEEEIEGIVEREWEKWAWSQIEGGPELEN